MANRLQQARDAGYSDDEIAEFLQTSDPKMKEALDAGYSLDEVEEFLSQQGAEVSQGALEPEAPPMARGGRLTPEGRERGQQQAAALTAEPPGMMSDVGQTLEAAGTDVLATNPLQAGEAYNRRIQGMMNEVTDESKSIAERAKATATLISEYANPVNWPDIIGGGTAELAERVTGAITPEVKGKGTVGERMRRRTTQLRKSRSKEMMESLSKFADKPLINDDAEWTDMSSWSDISPLEEPQAYLAMLTESMAYIVPALWTSRAGAAKAMKETMQASKVRGLVDEKVIREAAQKVGVRTGVATGSAVNYMLIKDSLSADVRERINNTSDEVWEKNEDFKKLVASGMDPDRAKIMIADQQGLMWGRLGAGVSSLLGLPGTGVFAKIGTGQKGGIKGFAEAVGMETASEAVQEAWEQLSGNLGVKGIDPEVDAWEGVGKSAFVGGLLGGVIAGPTSISRRPTETLLKKAGYNEYVALAKKRDAAAKVFQDPAFGQIATPEDWTSAHKNHSDLARQADEMMVKIWPDVRKVLRKSGADEQGLAGWDMSYKRAKANLKQRKDYDAQIKAADKRRAAVAKRAGEVDAAVTEVEQLSDLQQQLTQITDPNQEVTEEVAKDLVEQGYAAYNERIGKHTLTQKGARRFESLPIELRQAQDQIDQAGAERKGDKRDVDRRTQFKEMYEEDPDAAIETFLTDDLTGLPVARARALDEQREGHKPHAFVDIDNLGFVNDQMGKKKDMALGDKYIKMVARALKNSAKKFPGVTVYKETGGDEISVRGDSEEEIQTFLKNVDKRLAGFKPVVGSNGSTLQPSITWGTGADLDAATEVAGQTKVGKQEAGTAPKTKGGIPPVGYTGATREVTEETGEPTPEGKPPDFQRNEYDERMGAGYPLTLRTLERQIRSLEGRTDEFAIKARTSLEQAVQRATIQEKQAYAEWMQRQYYTKQRVDRKDLIRLRTEYASLTNEQKLRYEEAAEFFYAPMMGSILVEGVDAYLIEQSNSLALRGRDTHKDLQKSGDHPAKSFPNPTADAQDQSYTDLVAYSEMAVRIRDMMVEHEDGVMTWFEPELIADLQRASESWNEALLFSKDDARAITPTDVLINRVDRYLQVESNLGGPHPFSADVAEYKRIANSVYAWDPVFHTATDDIMGPGFYQTLARNDKVEIITPDGNFAGTVVEANRKSIVVEWEGDTLYSPETGQEENRARFSRDYGWQVSDRLARRDVAYEAQRGRWQGQGRLGRIQSREGQVWETYEQQMESIVEAEDNAWQNAGVNAWKKRARENRASEEDMDKAHIVVDALLKGYQNLPSIRLVRDASELPEYRQMSLATPDEDGNVWGPEGIRGYFGDGAVWVVVGNANAAVEMGFADDFVSAIAETVMHETIGHYGIRGVVRDELSMKVWGDQFIKAFPEVAAELVVTQRMLPSLPSDYNAAVSYAQGALDNLTDNDRLVLGEELMAHMAGLLTMGNEEITASQRSLWQRFMAWFKTWLTNRGYGQFVTFNEGQLARMIANAQTFVMEGNGWSYQRLVGRPRVAYMRNQEAFSAPMLKEMNATRKATKAERKQGHEIMPIWPHTGTAATYRQILRSRVKDQNVPVTQKEVDWLGLDGFLENLTVGDVIAMADGAELPTATQPPPNLQKVIKEGGPHSLEERERLEVLANTPWNPKDRIPLAVIDNYIRENAAVLYPQYGLNPEQNLDMGYDEETQQWFNEEKDTYTETKYKAYTPAGTDFNAYREYTFVQANPDPGAFDDAHWGEHGTGVISHMRISAAQIDEAGGTPNPAHNGKAYEIIEIQSPFQQRKVLESTTDHVSVERDKQHITAMMSRATIPAFTEYGAAIRKQIESRFNEASGAGPTVQLLVVRQWFEDFQADLENQFPTNKKEYYVGDARNKAQWDNAVRQETYEAITNSLKMMRRKLIRGTDILDVEADQATADRMGEMLDAFERVFAPAMAKLFNNNKGSRIIGQPKVWEKFIADLYISIGLISDVAASDLKPDASYIQTFKIPASAMPPNSMFPSIQGNKQTRWFDEMWEAGPSRYLEGYDTEQYWYDFTDSGDLLVHIAMDKGADEAAINNLKLALSASAGQMAIKWQILEQARRVRAEHQKRRQEGLVSDRLYVTDPDVLLRESGLGPTESRTIYETHGVIHEDVYTSDEATRASLIETIRDGSARLEADVTWEDTIDDAGLAVTGAHPVYQETFKNEGFRAANYWLDQARIDWMIKNLTHPGTPQFEKRRTRLKREYEDSGRTVLTGILPTRWDENGDARDHITLTITRGETDPGQRYPIQSWKLYLDGGYVAETIDTDSRSTLIARAYNDILSRKGSTPPVGKFPVQPVSEMRPGLQRNTLQKDMIPKRQPEFQAIADKMADNIGVVASSESGSIDGMWKKLVDIDTRVLATRGHYETQPQSPYVKNWRKLALQWSIMDATRRGYNHVVWQPGDATLARGGNNNNTTVVNEVTVFKNHVPGVGEAWTISSPDLHVPNLVVTDKDLSRMLGVEAGKIIRAKHAINANSAPQLHNVVKAGDKWLVVEDSQSGRHKKIIGEFDNVAEAAEEAAVQNEAYHLAFPNDPRLNKITVDHNEIGGPILMPTGDTYYWDEFYNADFDSDRNRRQLKGGRESYDEILVAEANRYLKKYGVRVKPAKKEILEEFMADAMVDEGAKRQYRLTQDFVDANPNIRVAEMSSGGGWVVISDKGIAVDTIFNTRNEATRAMRIQKEKNSFDWGESAFINMHSFEITEEMAADHKQGDMPMFHRRGKGSFGGDPKLQEYSEEVFAPPPRRRKVSEVWGEAYRHFKAYGVQNILDRFHGIKKAMESIEYETDGLTDPYLHARMTTGLDGIMRGIMEWGYPVWKDGVVDHEGGKGLLEILAPIENQLEEWGAYMAARRAETLMEEDRENLMRADQIKGFIDYGNNYPIFKKVADDYAEFNKKVLDFAESSGLFDSESRAVWEHAEYVPFWRINTDPDENGQWMHGMGRNMGLANQKNPINRLKGGTNPLGEIVNNIIMNYGKLVDASIKNNAALMAVDALKNTGTIHEFTAQPMDVRKRMIPKKEIRRVLKDSGLDEDFINKIPDKVFNGLADMWSIESPIGRKGVISVIREGKREYHYTEDDLLWKSMTAIDMKKLPRWMDVFRWPKRFLTLTITLDPGFAIRNFFRDFLSAWTTSRDSYFPFWRALKGFWSALAEKEDYKQLVSSGAAFDSGYLNYGDPYSVGRQIKVSLRDKKFGTRRRTVLDTPHRLYDGYKAILSAAENANRMAIYNAALAAGKTRLQASFEAKDIMDFSMGGSASAAQFLIQTVPFMNARAQGIYRLVRGATEVDPKAQRHIDKYRQPYAFAMKGIMIMTAGLALYWKYKDDERYKALDDFQKDGYFNWWIGDHHFALPKPFEVGAIFNTLPERAWQFVEEAWDEDPNAWRHLRERLTFMAGETFSFNPIPQLFKPFAEDYINRSFFTDRAIVNYYEGRNQPPIVQQRYYTSPTAAAISSIFSLEPSPYSAVPDIVRSPLRLEALYRGFTGTLGRYALMGTDAIVRNAMEAPLPPAISPKWFSDQKSKGVFDGNLETLERLSYWPVIGSFYKGTHARRTKYEQHFYDLLQATMGVDSGMNALERMMLDDLWDEIDITQEKYWGVADAMNDYRIDITEINQAIMDIYQDPDMDPDKKREELEIYQQDKNEIFKDAYELRPGGADNPVMEINVQSMLDAPFDELTVRLENDAPITASLLNDVLRSEETAERIVK